MSDEHQTAYDDICAALGHAVSCWAGVESELSRIYATAVKSPDMGVAIESFYAAIGFDNRLKMTDVAMRSLCRQHTDTLKRWNNLVNRTKRQSKTRNKLAHGMVQCLGKPTPYPPKEPPQFAGCWFIPYFGMWRERQGIFGISKKGLEAAEKLNAKNLRQIAAGYNGLTGDLQTLFLGEVVAITSGKKK